MTTGILRAWNPKVEIFAKDAYFFKIKKNVFHFQIHKIRLQHHLRFCFVV